MTAKRKVKTVFLSKNFIFPLPGRDAFHSIFSFFKNLYSDSIVTAPAPVRVTAALPVRYCCRQETETVIPVLFTFLIAEPIFPVPSHNEYRLRSAVCLHPAFHPNRVFEEEVFSDIVTEKELENNIKYPKVFTWRTVSSPDDDTFKPLHVLFLSGINLKIHTEAEAEGVFWIDAEGGTFKTAAVIASSNTTLQFQIPELAPGTCRLTIAARLANNALRSTTLDKPLTVS
ncbi:MAG: DUF4469 domain-containing protein [Spirochaetales bacterium]|nr:MAG: DUF4469 domain-containing protein [Spirochaetales bacterium]